MLSYNWLLKRHRDRGDAVLVTVLICIPLFMAAFMFAVGMAQNGWFKASFSDAAQAAAQKAAGAINNAGYLGENSVDTFVSDYMQLTNRTANPLADSAAYQSAEGSGSTCSTVDVNGITHQSPYIEIRLDRNRAAGVNEVSSPLYVSEGGAPAKAVFTLNTHVNYRVLSATVYESSHSLLGDGFTVLGKKAGCFTSKSVVSGITFGSNSDLDGMAP